MKELENYVKELVKWFDLNQISYSLIGGIAVAFRAIERATKDVDFAIAVSNDEQAENIIMNLRSLGFKVNTLLEQTEHGRIATVRLLRGASDSVYIDLLFSSSGIEKEIVSTSEDVELFSDFNVKIASLPALLAMKVLSNSQSRPQDLLDIKSLLQNANNSEIEEATKLLKLIAERGYGRKKDLINEFEGFKKLFL
jgi:predicted nucleotidyltransferase